MTHHDRHLSRKWRRFANRLSDERKSDDRPQLSDCSKQFPPNEYGQTQHHRIVQVAHDRSELDALNLFAHLLQSRSRISMICMQGVKVNSALAKPHDLQQRRSHLKQLCAPSRADVRDLKIRRMTDYFWIRDKVLIARRHLSASLLLLKSTRGRKVHL